MATKIRKLERLPCALGAWTQLKWNGSLGGKIYGKNKKPMRYYLFLAFTRTPKIFVSVNMPVPIKDNLKIFTEISVQGKAIHPKIVP